MMPPCFNQLHYVEKHETYTVIQVLDCTFEISNCRHITACWPSSHAVSHEYADDSRNSVKHSRHNPLKNVSLPPSSSSAHLHKLYVVCLLPRRPQLAWIRDALNVNGGSRWGAAACIRRDAAHSFNCPSFIPHPRLSKPPPPPPPPPLHFTPNSNKYNSPPPCVLPLLSPHRLLCKRRKHCCSPPVCAAYTVAIKEVSAEKHVTQHTHTPQLPYLWMSMGEH